MPLLGRVGDEPAKAPLRVFAWRNLYPSAILSFSRGFLLIHRAARAVCRSGLWNLAPGGCRRGPAFGYSGPWPVFDASPRWQRQNKSI